jgi:hypothetical protein
MSAEGECNIVIVLDWVGVASTIVDGGGPKLD